MDNISTLIAQKDYKGLAQCCEQAEITSASGIYVDLAQVYPIYLAACILTDDLQSARYVRKRILSSRMNTPEIDAIWSVVTALIKKLYPEVYQQLDSAQWTEYMVPLIEDIKSSTRDHMLVLVSSIYTSIELKQASEYFGVPEDQVLQEFSSKGWGFNESTRILYPVKPAPASRVATDMNQFAKLSDIVLNLEKF